METSHRLTLPVLEVAGLEGRTGGKRHIQVRLEPNAEFAFEYACYEISG